MTRLETSPGDVATLRLLVKSPSLALVYAETANNLCIPSMLFIVDILYALPIVI
jgi:hypothetical protein